MAADLFIYNTHFRPLLGIGSLNLRPSSLDRGESGCAVGSCCAGVQRGRVGQTTCSVLILHGLLLRFLLVRGVNRVALEQWFSVPGLPCSSAEGKHGTEDRS